MRKLRDIQVIKIEEGNYGVICNLKLMSTHLEDYEAIKQAEQLAILDDDIFKMVMTER